VCVAHLANFEALSEGTPPLRVKPRLRGVSHQYAFGVAAAAGAALVAFAPAGEPRVAAAVYALSLCAMLGTSALYHRVDWSPARARLMRRLDHAMIFVLIAGTYTPFALLVLSEGFGRWILAVAWGGALAGVGLTVAWIDAPRWLTAAAYVALGWVAVAAFPQIVDRAGVAGAALLGVGGLLYTAGAVVYARQRPDPVPAVFGFHEVFHVFVLAAAAAHYIAVAAYAIPR
jgi:hemolysin III